MLQGSVPDRLYYCKKMSSKTISSKTTLHKYNWILAITFMFNYAGYLGVLSLQSSINIEEGLGTTSVLVIFVTSAVSCLLFVPFLIDFFGAKASLIIGELAVVLYIVSNFYPTWATLIPAAVFHGLLESAPWTASPVMVTYLGEQFELAHRRSLENKAIDNKRDVDFYVYRGFGRFFSAVYLGQILGSALVALIFHAFSEAPAESSNIFVTNVTDNLVILHRANITDDVFDVPKDLTDISNCGANDCPANYIYNATDGELDKFQPSALSTYFLLTLFTVTSLVFITVQAIFLPRPPAKYDKKERENAVEAVAADVDQVLEKNDESRIRQNLKQQLLDLIRHIISFQHVLVCPFMFYYGICIGYILAEYTRAYVSCTVGVEQVGTALTIFAVTGFITLTASSHIVRFVGRRKYILMMFVIHMSTYLVSLLWTPLSTNTWVVYLLAVMYGLFEGSTCFIAETTTALYFRDRLGIAFSARNLLTNLGIAAVNGWSTSFCVNIKIYLQLGILIFSVVTLVVADLYHTRSKKLAARSAEEEAVEVDVG